MVVFSSLSSYFNQHYFDLLLEMTKREVKIKYKHASLGLMWSILQPILQMLIIGFIFSFFIKMDIKYYFLFLLSGILPWEFFLRSVTKCTTSYVDQRHIIQKAKFPLEIIVLSIIFSNLFDLLIALPILFLLGIFLVKIQLVYIFIYLIALLFFVIFTIGLSLLTSSLNVQYRDVKFITEAMLRLWFYVTPVVYSLSLIPDKFRLFFALNPLTVFFSYFQKLIIEQIALSSTVVFSNVLILLAIIALGIYQFNKRSDYFIDWL